MSHRIDASSSVETLKWVRWDRRLVSNGKWLLSGKSNDRNGSDSAVPATAKQTFQIENAAFKRRFRL
jgi:hypothetical protein